AIVNYVLIYNHDLLPYLSPVQSPMLCTAIYMKKYNGIGDRLAALSPCIAKTHEFEATRYADYNVTLKKIYEYIRRNGIILPREESGFDHGESSLGRLFSMPGGLKENIELYLGKSLRIDKSEGQDIVYGDLELYSRQNPEYLPAVFDVLNCPNGCNMGTGCEHKREIFEINSIMDSARRDVLSGRDKADFESLFEEYDRTLRLDDFLRDYKPRNSRSYDVTNEQLENAFRQLGKETQTEREFDCSACGAETCLEMAKKIVCGLNIPNNCIQKNRNDIRREHNAVLELSSANLVDIKEIMEDISKIKEVSDEILQNIDGVNDSIKRYNKMATEIDSIAMHINIISLNASIEAARAGQYGKTFAVVAEEIRGLAKTSKKTVSETEQITGDAMEAIEKINSMVDLISSEVEKAYRNISDISEKTQDALAKSEI
ncbi:MAG: methyl-accepting chemotaxis protein, partial [Oscillospiraceae bacterium]|nr:methyl-accepting chemotaxis protein [Oscillospiraceae bacterium]